MAAPDEFDDGPAHLIAALKAGEQVFANATCESVALSTGVKVEYAMIECGDVEASDGEERLVMIMGMSATKEAWGPMLHQLLPMWTQRAPGKRIKVLVFDNRGIGGTDTRWGAYSTKAMAKDTLALLDHVGWPSAHLVGISLGGMISLQIASSAPERIQSLALIVTTRGKYKREHSYVSIARTLLFESRAKVVMNLISNLYPDTFLDQNLSEDQTVREALFELHTTSRARRAPALRGIIGQALAVFSHFVTDEQLNTIASGGFPILVVSGRRDRLIPATESDRLQTHLSKANPRFLAFDDAGHGCILQHVHQFSYELLHHCLSQDSA